MSCTQTTIWFRLFRHSAKALLNSNNSIFSCDTFSLKLTHPLSCRVKLSLATQTSSSDCCAVSRLVHICLFVPPLAACRHCSSVGWPTSAECYCFPFHVVHISLRSVFIHSAATAPSTRKSHDTLERRLITLTLTEWSTRTRYDAVCCSKVDSVVNRLAAGSVHKCGNSRYSCHLLFFSSSNIYR